MKYVIGAISFHDKEAPYGILSNIEWGGGGGIRGVCSMFAFHWRERYIYIYIQFYLKGGGSQFRCHTGGCTSLHTAVQPQVQSRNTPFSLSESSRRFPAGKNTLIHTHSHSFTVWITVWNYSSHCEHSVIHTLNECEWVCSFLFRLSTLWTIVWSESTTMWKRPNLNIVEHTVIHSVNQRVWFILWMSVNKCILFFSDYPHCEPQCETNRPQCGNAPI